jgi:hypothetical protein
MWPIDFVENDTFFSDFIFKKKNVWCGRNIFNFFVFKNKNKNDIFCFI